MMVVLAKLGTRAIDYGDPRYDVYYHIRERVLTITDTDTGKQATASIDDYKDRNPEDMPVVIAELIKEKLS